LRDRLGPLLQRAAEMAYKDEACAAAVAPVLVSIHGAEAADLLSNVAARAPATSGKNTAALFALLQSTPAYAAALQLLAQRLRTLPPKDLHAALRNITAAAPQTTQAPSQPFVDLVNTCVRGLEATYTTPLVKPVVRLEPYSCVICPCPSVCARVNRFLQTDEESTEVRAAQPIRTHVQRCLLNRRVVMETIRRGSPHTLRITKCDVGLLNAWRAHEELHKLAVSAMKMLPAAMRREVAALQAFEQQQQQQQQPVARPPQAAAAPAPLAPARVSVQHGVAAVAPLRGVAPPAVTAAAAAAQIHRSPAAAAAGSGQARPAADAQQSAAKRIKSEPITL
jgi:hypothetical protein